MTPVGLNNESSESHPNTERVELVGNAKQSVSLGGPNSSGLILLDNEALAKVHSATTGCRFG